VVIFQAVREVCLECEQLGFVSALEDRKGLSVADSPLAESAWLLFSKEGRCAVLVSSPGLWTLQSLTGSESVSV
jgi:hypothetical protein